MQQYPQTRRQFLRNSSLLVAGAALGRAETPKIPVRKDLGKLDADSPDIVALAKAYTEMNKLPDEDPHSWVFQANIHGIPRNSTTPTIAKGVWETCQHGNWWFFPWHRAYLHFFERIVRKYSCSADFALPYWYWDSTTSNQRVLNAVFLADGPLYHKSRGGLANGGSEFLDPDRIAYGKAAAMQEAAFEGLNGAQGFGGPKVDQPAHKNQPHGLLEESPHDYVHVSVSGDMGHPETAGRDQLFWLHHANIDRLWVEWRKNGGQNSTDDDWLKQEFSFFNEAKNKVAVAVRDLLDMTKLNYVYDLYDSEPALAAKRLTKGKSKVNTVSQFSRPSQELTAEPLKVPIKLEEKAQAVLTGIAVSDPQKGEAGHALLTIRGVRFADGPDSIIDVYLNVPEGTKRLTPADPHYAGTISFFGRDHGHDHDEGLTAEVSIAKAIRALQKRDEWKKGAVEVTLVRTPAGEKGAVQTKMSFDKVTLDASGAAGDSDGGKP